MTKNILFIDFETNDPYIELAGPGWAYGKCEILCCGYREGVTNNTKITESQDEIKELVAWADTIVAHNAQYDIGILYSLFDNPIEIFKNKTLIDTIILAKLYNNIEEHGYSLDSLGKKYTNIQKTADSLGDVVLNHKLINCKDQTTKLSKTKALNFAYKNMRLVYKTDKETVQNYCRQDVDVLVELYKIFIEHTSREHLEDFSILLKILIESRLRGINVNVESLYELKTNLNKKSEQIRQWLADSSGDEFFNPMSNQDVSFLLLKTFKTLPKTEKGNISLTGKWLEEQDNEYCKAVVEYRGIQKLVSCFCDAILEIQSVLPEKYKGKIYPSFTLLGAETGRFTSSKPNFQQIPSPKKKEEGKLIRSSYTVPDGKLWASIDFSAQEPRMTVHYASVINAKGADLLELEYNKNPNLDLHQITANLAGVTRNQAKVLLLGISYGMGKGKLAKALELNESQAEVFLESFHTKLPYLKKLSEAAKSSLKLKKSITTIDGRKLRLPKPIIENGRERTFEYKALNMLIQGGSAGQIMKAMIHLYKAGFKIIASIHDEINLEVDSVEEALEAKKIMENAIKLRVPSVGELTIGHSWGSCVAVEEFTKCQQKMN